MLSYKIPSKTAERTLNRHMELCRWLYNRLLSELNLAKEKKDKAQADRHPSLYR